MNKESHQYVNVYRSQFTIAFVLKFVFLPFRQKILEIMKLWTLHFGSCVFHSIASSIFISKKIILFVKKMVRSRHLFLFYF